MTVHTYSTHLGDGQTQEVQSVAELPTGTCPRCETPDVILAADGQCAHCHLETRNERLSVPEYQAEVRRLKELRREIEGGDAA